MAQKQSLHYELLREKWIGRHRQLEKNLWSRHRNVLQRLVDSSKEIAVGSIASVIMLIHPLSGQLLAQNFSPLPTHVMESAPIDKKEDLMVSLLMALPKKVAPLTSQQEKDVTQILEKIFGVTVTAEMERKRLNRNYGLIGAEQHLMRFPGDSVENMAPGRGGWGYFDNAEQEKYYIAVPVFLCDGWKERVPEYVKFFRFRKMLVVNPENGKGVVAVVGDSGPAEFTGKHLGGSPEVMDYLERVDGSQKGPVLYFFLDDPENKIPLGPIAVK